MLEFIINNYLIIMIISLFLIFALIGYIIDSFRIQKREESKEVILNEEVPASEEELEITNALEPSEEIIQKEEVISSIPEENKQEPVIPEVEEIKDNK
ncbi:MAG: hypothetical protein PHF21_02395 [Bacilli bacterium]|nr:hypothetical protein [Bacilli bacterium]